MRKIESDMLAAIKAGKDWKSGNTCVEFSTHRGNPYLSATVYLHGNVIAHVLPDGHIDPDPDTFHEWPTPTTASRLRALGFDAGIRKGTPYIDGIAL